MPPVELSVSKFSGLGKCVAERENQRLMWQSHTCTISPQSILGTFKLFDTDIESFKDFRGVIGFDFDFGIHQDIVRIYSKK